ncbi:MAG TPA: L,D-transpeptidase family protein [Thermoanaerobaculia bacterium]|jgi:murein L,D-transpeptidase YcbB/YkuD|nr:L,D-transpeptidase family protein [Thermoanaerobaculia bacterium]
MRYLLWLLIFISSVLPSPPQLVPAAPEVKAPDPALILLRERFPAAGEPLRLELDGRSYRVAPELACFYERRSFLPAWSTENGLLPVADQLLAALGGAADEGLHPEDYRLAALQGLADAVRRTPLPAKRAELDLAFSDAFFAFAADLANGRINPEAPKKREAIDSACAPAADTADSAALLEAALGGTGVKNALSRVEPSERSYRLLREALLRYRAQVRRGDPTPISEGPKLRLGDRGERVIQLRQRLYAAAQTAGDELPLASPSPESFDEPLAQAVRRFQARNGFEEDGVVGAATLAELNRPAEDRVRQIEANLERLRWLPSDLGARYVRVNIPAFRLDAVEGDRSVLTLRVIVGKPGDTSTPTFSSAMNAVQLNPSWYVPKKILDREILPKAGKDPTFLGRLGYEVVSQDRLRQRPGPSNALGKFKFVFPSRYGVYLHDTPSRTLFNRELRALSHGCVRVENPFELAVWALRNDPQWTPEAIRERVDSGKERQVKLPEALPVHIGYWTAWAGDDGVLRFGRDVYKQDAELIRRLQGEKKTG